MSSSPPLWLLVLLPVIDFGLPALFLCFGLLLFRKTLKARTRTDLSTKNCAKCRYDMRAATSLTCPECGYTHKSSAQLHPHKRTFYPKLILATLLCFPGLCVLYISLTYYPAAYLESRQTQSTIAHLRSLGAQCNPDLDITLENPSAWTLQVWAWISKLPIGHTFYNGFSPSDRRILLLPRLLHADHPISPIAETFLNWTWSPSRNYHWYLPLSQYWELSFTGGPPYTLTPDDARRICDIRYLHQIHLGPEVLVDGPTLAAFASFSQEIEQSYLQVENYQPTPWDNTGWPAAGPIKALTSIDIDARNGASESLFTMLASCPNLRALSIRATPQTPHEKLLKASLKFNQLEILSFQGLQITPGDLEKLKHYNDLYYLVLDLPPNSPLTDADLAPLNNLPKLRRITLKNAPRVSGTFLLSIKSELEGVFLSNIPFDDQAFAALMAHTHLSELSLQNTQVTLNAFKKFIHDDSIRSLAHGSGGMSAIRYDKPVDLETCQFLFATSHTNIALDGVDDEQLNLFLSNQRHGRLELYNHHLSNPMAAQVKAGHFNSPSSIPEFRREVILMNDFPSPDKP